MSEIIAGLAEFFADIDWGAFIDYASNGLKALPALPIYIIMIMVAGVATIFDSITGIDTTVLTEPIMAFLSYIMGLLIIP